MVVETRGVSVLVQGQPLSYALLQRLGPRLHFFEAVEESQPSSVGVIALQESRSVFDFRAAGKYQPDAILLMEIEVDEVSSVLLRIRGLHLTGVEESWRVPFDLLADLAIGAQNDFPQTRDYIRQRMLQFLHIGVDLVGFGRLSEELRFFLHTGCIAKFKFQDIVLAAVRERNCNSRSFPPIQAGGTARTINESGYQ